MSRCSHLAINDQGFVFDPTTGDSYTVNEVGLLLLEQLRAGKSDDEVVRFVSERFELGLVEARRAIDDFIGQLRTLGLAGGAQ